MSPAPRSPTRGTDMRPDGSCRDEARMMPGWETTVVVWGREGGGHDVAQAGSDG